MDIAPRTIENLAFPEVLRALAQRCRTPLGRERALARPFLEAAPDVQSSLDRIDEARRLAQEPLSLPFGALTDVRLAINGTAKGALLEPRDYVAVAQTLFALVRTREALTAREGVAPALATLARRMPALEDLARRIDRCFDTDGQISDRASPALKEARDRVRGLHRSIKAKLDQLLTDESFALNLREPYYSVRNERYVMPIVAQHRAEVPGIVHNASQSGQTLFIEPQAMVGLGNDLAIAQSMVVDEERRLLQQLSDAVGHHADAILEGLTAAGELDEVEAAALLCADLGLERPGVENPDGSLDLLQLRHPLLTLRGVAVVPNDVRLAEGVRSIIVSGPNAGGKTITLTAVGLCALMVRAGLPIPAALGSRIPLYGSIHSTLGDAQDLGEGLSTFSAHVSQLRQITVEATRGSLVLVDEIAADTDPREGAALAIAVLEDLLDRHAVVLVTTHLEELKALAHLDPRFVNARVGFDSRKMVPTYRLQLGAAGASSAIEMAARMGLSERICTRARELALGAGGPLSRALAATEEERKRLAEESDKAVAAQQAVVVLRDELEAQRAVLERRLRGEELEHQQALQAELQKTSVELRELITRLRAQASMREALEAQKQVAGRSAELEEKTRAAQASVLRAEKPSTPPELRVGGWVHHLGISKDVEILELDGEEALVAAGPLKMRVPTKELTAAQRGKPARAFPGADKKRESMTRATAAAAGAVGAANFRCDVRGMRSDEALRELEQFLDRLYRSNEESALILHGHGTGALKLAIRDSLSASPYVKSYRPGEAHEGGDGVTVVAFKQ